MPRGGHRNMDQKQEHENNEKCNGVFAPSRPRRCHQPQPAPLWASAWTSCHRTASQPRCTCTEPSSPRPRNPGQRKPPASGMKNILLAVSQRQRVEQCEAHFTDCFGVRCWYGQGFSPFILGSWDFRNKQCCWSLLLSLCLLQFLVAVWRLVHISMQFVGPIRDEFQFIFISGVNRPWICRMQLAGNCTPGVDSRCWTYVCDLHFLLVVHAVDTEAALVDEVIQTRIFLHQQLSCERTNSRFWKRTFTMSKGWRGVHEKRIRPKLSRWIPDISMTIRLLSSGRMPNRSKNSRLSRTCQEGNNKFETWRNFGKNSVNFRESFLQKI